MIHFFRKIRSGLLFEGKRKSYLLYALGEIVLVVFGILIALQINSWNEERIKSNNLLLSLLQQDTPDRSKLVRLLRGSITKTGSIFKVSKTGFEDLKSSGNLHILHDQEIKNLLINYYSRVDNYIDVLSVNSQFAVETYYESNKDFADLGWQNLDYVRAEIDSSLIRIELLNQSPYPNPVLRKQLMSDALLYMTTNARKKMLFNELASEIVLMQELMNSKCDQTQR